MGKYDFIIPTYFHSMVAKYDWIFGFSISMLRGETLFDFMSLHPPGRNENNLVLQCYCGIIIGK